MGRENFVSGAEMVYTDDNVRCLVRIGRQYDESLFQVSLIKILQNPSSITGEPEWTVDLNNPDEIDRYWFVRRLIPVTILPDMPQDHLDEFLSHGFEIFRIRHDTNLEIDNLDPYFEIHQNGKNILDNPSVVTTSGLWVSVYEVIGPRVGAPATIIMYSDRHAATVTEVLRTKDGSVKGVRVRRDHATRTDSNGMSDCQSYAYSNHGEGSEYDARLVIPKKPINNKLGKYGLYVNGPVKDWSYKIVIGYRREYHDFSF